VLGWRAVAVGVRYMALGRLSGLVAEYGKVAVGVHLCNSVTFLSAAVTGVHYGMDVSAVTALLPVTTSIPTNTFAHG